MKVLSSSLVISVVVLVGALGVHRVNGDHQSHLPVQLRSYGTAAMDLPGFSPTGAAPRITAERYSPNPAGPLSARYAEIFGSPPKPGRVVNMVQEFHRTATNEHPGATLRISTSIYTDGQYALLAADPNMRSVSRVGAFQPGTYSGYGLGQASWVTTSTGRPELDRSLKIAAADGRVVTRVDLWPQPMNTNDRNPGWRPLADLDHRVSEFAVRLALSYGLLADIDFGRAPRSAITVRGTRLEGRKPAEDLILVPLRSVLKTVDGNLAGGEFGVYQAMVGGGSLRVAIASRELIAGHRKITLPLPILFDGKEIWIEKNGLASALRLDIAAE